MAKRPNRDLRELVEDSDVLNTVLNLSGTFPEADQLSLAVNYLVGRTRAAFVGALSRDAEALNLSPARLQLVIQLYYSEGRRLPMKELGDRLAVTPGNITRLVSGLVSQGFIRRDTPEANRRTTFAELTPAGVQAFETAMPIILGASRERLRVLDDGEKEFLIRVLAKLRRALLAPED